jgi:antitoxin VapB
MSLNIKHPDADKLARALANKTGESITQAVIIALKERLLREEGRNLPTSLTEELLKIAERCSHLPDLDRRSPDEILGYDQHGIPGYPPNAPPIVQQTSHRQSPDAKENDKNDLHGNHHGTHRNHHGY